MKLFITASGTDIGKTYVTSHLCRELRSSGQSVCALKPVISGFSESELDECDSGVLLRSLGQDVTLENIARITPWRFTDPISPDMAARRENREIEFARLIDFCEQSLGEEYEHHLIEGVGGVMVPLDGKHTVLDWIAALNIELLLVVGSYLGSLSHTLTAASTIKTNGLKMRAIIVSESEISPVPLAETVQTLKIFLPDETVLFLPRMGEGRALLPQLMAG